MLTADETGPFEPDLALDVVPLCADSWRITDPRVPLNSAECLLAYVEREGSGYTVMLLRPGRPRTIAVESLEAAVALVEASRGAARTELSAVA